MLLLSLLSDKLLSKDMIAEVKYADPAKKTLKAVRFEGDKTFTPIKIAAYMADRWNSIPNATIKKRPHGYWDFLYEDTLTTIDWQERSVPWTGFATGFATE